MSKLSQITAVIANAVCAALCGLVWPRNGAYGKVAAKAEMPTVIDAKALVPSTASPVSFSDDNDKP